MSQLWDRSLVANAALSTVVLLDQLSDRPPLLQVLNELELILKQRGQPFEILIPVASQQSLTEVMELPSVRQVVDANVNDGVGSALNAGILAAQHPLIFVLPIGYSPAVLPAFLKEIDQVDLVCGVRESRTHGWKRRQFFSAAYQVFGLWMQDPECPVRLYRREMFQRIPLQSKGAFVHVEILAKANFQSKLMTEVPVTGPDSESSRIKQDFWRVLNHPQFGPPPEKTIEQPVKSIIQTQAPEVRS